VLAKFSVTGVAIDAAVVVSVPTAADVAVVVGESNVVDVVLVTVALELHCLPLKSWI
jgi:hypothetical protein